eukprot:12910272-Heterocapsa_arctica.AAC.1
MLIDDEEMKEIHPVRNGQCIPSERAPLTISEWAAQNIRRHACPPLTMLEELDPEIIGLTTSSSTCYGREERRHADRPLRVKDLCGTATG